MILDAAKELLILSEKYGFFSSIMLYLFKKTLDSGQKGRGLTFMTLQQLQYAIAVADYGSISEASKQLYVTQPAISEQLKELEREIGQEIFLRSNHGILLTARGEEFLSYARQVTEQFSYLQNTFIEKQPKEKFAVSTQHYGFAVKAFVDMVKQFDTDQYEFGIYETTTSNVIEHVKSGKSEIGILYLNDFNRKILYTKFNNACVEFIELKVCDVQVYLGSSHPLASRKELSLEELGAYPYLAFDQGREKSFYMAEEMKSTYPYPRIIKASDRASMLNLMTGLNAYTLCSSIDCQELNGPAFCTVPLKEKEQMHIGYIQRKFQKQHALSQIYLKELCKAMNP